VTSSKTAEIIEVQSAQHIKHEKNGRSEMCSNVKDLRYTHHGFGAQITAQRRLSEAQTVRCGIV